MPLSPPINVQVWSQRVMSTPAEMPTAAPTT